MSNKYLNIDWVGPYLRAKIQQLAKCVKTIKRLKKQLIMTRTTKS